MDAFSQPAAANTQQSDTIDWTVRCDWLQVPARYSTQTILCIAIEGGKTCTSLAGLPVSFIAIVKTFSLNI